MSAPKGNQYAAKAPQDRRGDQITLRAPSGLKGRAVRAARKRHMKLSPWLVEAIAEKIERETV